MKRNLLAGGVVAGLLVAASASFTSGAVLTLNTSTAQVGTGQVIKVLVTPGGEGPLLVNSLDFFAQVGDGGAANGGGSTIRPKITNLNLTADANALFNGATTTTFYDLPSLSQGSPDYMVYDNAAFTVAGSVSDAGTKVLATLTFDTTGMNVGDTFNLYFAGVDAINDPPGGDTLLQEVDANANTVYVVPLTGPGSTSVSPAVITIVAVPEPTTVLALMPVAAGALLRRRRAGLSRVLNV